MDASFFARDEKGGACVKKFATLGAIDASFCPPEHKTEEPHVQRTRPALVIVMQELGLIRRHVNVDGAFVFAAFTCQAKVERFANRLVLPTSVMGLAASISKSRRALPRVE